MLVQQVAQWVEQSSTNLWVSGWVSRPDGLHAKIPPDKTQKPHNSADMYRLAAVQ